MLGTSPRIGIWASISLHQDDGTQPAHYPSGRATADDVYSLRFAWLSHGKIPSGVKNP